MVHKDKKQAIRAFTQKVVADRFSIAIARASGVSLGYRQLNITVEDADTGERVAFIPTARKPEDIEQLIEEIRETASLPKELWAEITHKSALGEKDVQYILDGQYLGGRPPGMSEETAKKYRELVKWFYKTDLTQREFCTETGTKRRTLSRALEFVSKYGLD